MYEHSHGNNNNNNDNRNENTMARATVSSIEVELMMVFQHRLVELLTAGQLLLRSGVVRGCEDPFRLTLFYCTTSRCKARIRKSWEAQGGVIK